MAAGFGGTLLALAAHDGANAARASDAAGLADVRPAPAVYYRRCADARAAGAAPILRGQPGYRPALDRDDDGIACEPYPGP